MRSILLLILGFCFVLNLGCQKESAKPADVQVAPVAPKKPAATPMKKAKIKVVNTAPASPAGSQSATSRPATSRPATSQPTGALPAGHPPTGAGAAGAAGGKISGTITLGDAVKDKLKGGAQLFIIVRRDAGEGKKGMLVAAKKVLVQGPKTFPHAYQVSGADVMMQGTVFAGAMRVEARVDQDGDAISKQPGDLTGAMKTVSNVGASKQDFVLDKVL